MPQISEAKVIVLKKDSLTLANQEMPFQMVTKTEESPRVDAQVKVSTPVKVRLSLDKQSSSGTKKALADELDDLLEDDLDDIIRKEGYHSDDELEDFLSQDIMHT